MKKSLSIPTLLIALYIIVRLILLFHSNFIYTTEEYYFGTFAKDIITDKTLSISDMLIGSNAPYSGGIVIGSYFVALFYKMFGINGISLKLAFMTISLLTTIMFYLLIKKINKKSANLFLLFSAITFPFYSINSLSQAGPGFLSLLFQSTIMLYYFSKNSKKIIVGLLCGLSLLIHYDSIVLIFTLIIYLIIKKTYSNKYLFGFIIGIIPIALYNIFSNFAGLSLHPISSDYNPLIKLINFILYDLSDSFLFHIQYKPYLFLSYIMSIFIIIIIYKQTRTFYRLQIQNKTQKDNYKNISQFLVIYFISFILIYLISPFQIGMEFQFSSDEYRYILPLFPIMIFFISTYITSILTKRKRLLITSIILIIFTITNISLISPTVVDRSILFKTNNDAVIGTIIGDLYPDNILENINTCNNLKPTNSINNSIFCLKGLAVSIGRNIATQTIKNNTQNTIATKSHLPNCQILSQNYRSLCYQSIGYNLQFQTTENAIEYCKTYIHPNNFYCTEGALWKHSKMARYSNYDFQKYCKSLPPESIGICMENEGHFLLYKFSNNPNKVKEICTSSTCQLGYGRSMTFMLNKQLAHDICQTTECKNGTQEIKRENNTIPPHSNDFIFIADISH